MENNAVIHAIKYRRSVRTYAPTPLKKEDLALIAEAATYAPSGMNQRSFHFTVITDQKQLIELNQRIRNAFLNSSEVSLRKRGANENFMCYYHAPALVVVSNIPTQSWGPQDCACALQNMFLAAYSLGIGSCWINQLSNGISEDPSVRDLLTEWGVPQNHKVYGCAALGYPCGKELEPPARKEGLVTWVE